MRARRREAAAELDGLAAFLDVLAGVLRGLARRRVMRPVRLELLAAATGPAEAAESLRAAARELRERNARPKP